MTPGFTVWLTGRPRAGKTTLGQALAAALGQRGLAAQYLDGEELRRELSPGLGFSPSDRLLHAQRAAYVAGLLNRHGVICVLGLVSPQAEARRQARLKLGEFVEVHLDCSLEQAINRDQSGLYQRALAGQITGFTGLDDPYEPPEDPELRLDTGRQTPEQSLASIMDFLDRAGLLATPAGPARPDGEEPVYTREESRQIERRLEALGYL